jgi:hypothetical protein
MGEDEGQAYPGQGRLGLQSMVVKPPVLLQGLGLASLAHQRYRLAQHQARVVHCFHGILAEPQKGMKVNRIVSAERGWRKSLPSRAGLH